MLADAKGGDGLLLLQGLDNDDEQKDELLLVDEEVLDECVALALGSVMLSAAARA